MEAVKQGSPCAGLRSKTHAVLVAFKRQADELASYQEKLFKVDDHMAISISGLTADARFLCKHMRTECLNHKFVYGGTLQTGRLVTQVADMHQRCTQDGKSKRRRSNVAIIIDRIVLTCPFLFYCLLLNHSFPTNPNRITNCFKFFSSIYNYYKLHCSCVRLFLIFEGSYKRGRPFGVGLLVIGYDKTGPHVYQTCPSANYYEYKSYAIGARSQSAKTYLERHYETFDDLSLDELIAHGKLNQKATL